MLDFALFCWFFLVFFPFAVSKPRRCFVIGRKTSACVLWKKWGRASGVQEQLLGLNWSVTGKTPLFGVKPPLFKVNPPLFGINSGVKPDHLKLTQGLKFPYLGLTPPLFGVNSGVKRHIWG